MLIFSVSSLPVGYNVHKADRVQYSGHGDDRGDMSGDDGDKRRDTSSDYGEERGDISVDDGRCGFLFQ